MPDIESRLRYLESLTSHQTFNQSTRRPLEPIAPPLEPAVVFRETPVFDSYSHFVAHDTNYVSQRRLLLHQEQLQLRTTQGLASSKRLQGIDGVEGRDVLMGDDDAKVARILDWPQYSNPQLMAAIKRYQSNLLAKQQQQQGKKKPASSSTSLWNTLFPLKRASNQPPKNRTKRLLPDPAYVLHLVKLRIVDEQPHHAFQLLERCLIAPSVLRKQALKSLVNLIMLLALDKGYEDICIYLLTAGFPANPFSPIFGSSLLCPRRFPSYFLVAIARKRERVISWILQNTPTKILSSNINRAWFNGLRPLHVAQWNGTFSLTQMLLKAGAGVDRSISYLTYLRCRSYFLHHVQQQQHKLRESNSFELTKGYLLSTSSSYASSSTSSSARLRSNREVFKKSRLYALDFACATGRTESSQLLLKSYTPELLAANEFVLLMLPDAQVAWEIVNQAPNLLKKQRDLRGNTPLHLAARAGRVDLMAVFLSKESPGLVDALNGNHETPLHEAARSANRAAVQFLISHGADCSICNSEGLTALQVARRSGITSEELYDFFHATDTLKHTQNLLSAIISITTNSSNNDSISTPKAASKRLLIQKLLRYPKNICRSNSVKDIESIATTGSSPEKSEMLNERFLPDRSPFTAKYKRELEGNVLTRDAGTTTSNNNSPSSPQRTGALNRDRIYRQLFETEKTDKSPLFIAPILYPSSQASNQANSASKRTLNQAPIKILDAPGLEDDFYLNLVDWSAPSNQVVVLLGGGEVYFWDANNLNGSVSGNRRENSALGRTRSNTGNAAVERGCVVKCNPCNPSQLAVGTKQGSVELWDISKGRKINTWRGHGDMRCGVLSWQNSDELSSGGRDGVVVHYDSRAGITGKSRGHAQEVCGLKWDPHANYLASGGNDNLLLIWDRRKLSDRLLHLSAHCAAVKALDWSPHQSGLLASGGGTADRTIRFWNVKRAPPVFLQSPVEGFGSEPLGGEPASIPEQLCIQASSQICTLAWSPLCPGEILSTHGFSEHNLSLWSYPSGRCMGRLEGHSQRVLFQATGPDGSTVVTGSGDQTLRFWNVFRATSRTASSSNGKNIRRAADWEIFSQSR